MRPALAAALLAPIAPVALAAGALSAVALAAVALPAVAQPAPKGAPPPGIARVIGTVTAVTRTALTVRDAAGHAITVALPPGWVLVRGQRVHADALSAGEFVATASVDQPDGTGTSVEFRVFEPGAKLRAGNRPMPDVGQMMTNGTVTKVSAAPSGRAVDIAYPGGVRHVLVPSDLAVIQYSPADPAALTVGATVTALAARADDGTLAARRVSLDPR